MDSGANLDVPKLENFSAGFLSKYLMDFNIPYSSMAKMLTDFTKNIQFFGHGNLESFTSMRETSIV